MIVLYTCHLSFGPLRANKYALKIRLFFFLTHYVHVPFTALRIKTDLKIFSGNFIGKKTELYEVLGETEEKT